MGTFIDMTGDVNLPKEHMAEYREMMARLFRAGGMMELGHIQLDGHIFETLREPAPDKDGIICCDYNIYEGCMWETAGFSDHVFSGKVGWMQFCRVMSAALVLQEQLLDNRCYADLSDTYGFHRVMLGWLKYLFGDTVSLKFPDVWDIYYQLSKNERCSMRMCHRAIYYESISNYLALYTPIAMNIVEFGIDECLEYYAQDQEEYDSDKLFEKETVDELMSIARERRPQIQELHDKNPGKEEEILQMLLGWLCRRRDKANEEYEELRSQLLLDAVAPCGTQIVVKIIADVFERDFWELWEQVREGRIYRLTTINPLNNRPIVPLSTEEFLELEPDEMLHCLPVEKADTFSDEMKTWLRSLQARFRELLPMQPDYHSPAEFRKAIVNTFGRIADFYMQSKDAAYPFETMFYEFIDGYDNPNIRAWWKLFEEILPTAPLAEQRRYLALMANIPLRTALFEEEKQL
jgi:hypothetical protein